MGLLSGRVGLIVGTANERSLAYGIARAAQREGASLALTYQNERLRDGVVALGQTLDAALVLPCDVTDDLEVHRLMDAANKLWGRLDFVVHAVAAASRGDLQGRFIDTERKPFLQALEVSAYSLVSVARAAEPLLRAGHAPSILTLTYEASRRAAPHYNVMGVAKAALESAVRYLALDMGPHGIRVNALSAGPVKTLSAAGVPGLRELRMAVAARSPLRRNVDKDEVGAAALFSLSDLGRGMTGEIFHVDAGFHAVLA